MIQIIFSNFFGFDFLIFLLAFVNVYFAMRTKIHSKQLYSALHPSGWTPGGSGSMQKLAEHFKKHSDPTGEQEIMQLRRQAVFWHVLYENTTTIFPLMGLLGTVISLLPMVNSIGDTAVGLFYTALTSTFWGIVFAIIFKAADGPLLADMDDNEKNVDIYMSRSPGSTTGQHPKLLESADIKGEASDEKT